MRYIFEDYTFDTERRELRRGSDEVAITPQAFDLLDYLIRNRERVVSKDDLISAVWNRRVVSDAALTTRLNATRNAIGDSGEEQRLLKTLPRKGFRFVGSVQEMRTPVIATVVTNPGEQDLKCIARPLKSPLVEMDLAQQHTAAWPGVHPRPARLSIVVLPFTNLSGNPEYDYFVDSLTENLTTDLSRFSNLFVIARTNALSYAGKEIEVRQIGRDLNVRHVLEGSVQLQRNRLRVNVQLIDAENGKHLWAERFEKTAADLFNAEDEIISRLAYPLHGQIITAAARRAERLLTPDAKDLVFQGAACLFKANTPEYVTKACDFFKRALTIDPRNIGALFGMANVGLTTAFCMLTDDPAETLSTAETYAIKALSLSPEDPYSHFGLGGIYLLTNRVPQGIAEYEHALSLDRNLAGAHGAIGFGKVLMGRAAETEGHVLEAFRLSPRDMSVWYWMYFLGMAKIHLAADAEAVEWLRRSIEVNRNLPPSHFALAAAFGLLGRFEEARAAAKEGLSLNPGFTIRRFHAATTSSDPTFVSGQKRICEGMLRAGVPEG